MTQGRPHTTITTDARVRGMRRVRSRTWCARERSWTGRANLSRSTDSCLPEFVTAGTRRTRVSEMREVARIADRPVRGASRGPLAVIFERRRARGPRHQSDRGG